MHGEHRVPVGLFHVEDRLVAQDAGVVDQDVHAAERFERGRKQRFAAFDVCDRLRIGDRFAASSANLRDDVVGDLAGAGAVGVAAEVVDDDLRAFAAPSASRFRRRCRARRR